MGYIICGKVTTKEFLEREYGIDWQKSYAGDIEAVLAGHDAHYQTMEKARNVLWGLGVDEGDILWRPSRTYVKEDFIAGGIDNDSVDVIAISCGGDGELLDVARVAEGNSIYLGVKSDRHSTGALLSVDVDGLEDKLTAIVSEKYEIRQRQRVRVEIIYPDGTTITDDALNEVFIGDKYSVGFPRYELQINLSGNIVHEAQRSGGVVVATGTGSTAWIANIPVQTDDGVYVTEPFDAAEEKLAYVVRESMRSSHLRLLHGDMQKGDVLTVQYKERVDGSVSLDGSKEWYDGSRLYKIPPGGIIKVYLSPDPIREVR